MTPTPGFHMAADLEEAKRMIATMLRAPAGAHPINLIPSRGFPDSWHVFRVGSVDRLGTITAREDGCCLIVLERPTAQ